MSVNGVSNVTTTVPATYNTTSAKTEASSNTQTASESSGVVYESGSKETATKTTYANPDLVAKLKADSEARVSQLKSLVETMMSKQASKYSSVWEALASGTMKADPQTIAQAKKDIAVDGYWGVEQTSDRILSFAKALVGNDPSQVDKMRAAFEKGYGQATKAWGKELPSISKDTYDAVMKKFDDWAAESGK